MYPKVSLEAKKVVGGGSIEEGCVARQRLNEDR